MAPVTGTDLIDAWDKEKELVYPETPEKKKERWFLRTLVNPDNEDKAELIFIGMNPSKATEFSLNNGNNDRTIVNIINWQHEEEDKDVIGKDTLTPYILEEDNSPKYYRRITMLNLVSLVNSDSKKARKELKEIEAEEMQEKYVAPTIALLDHILQQSRSQSRQVEIVLMYGAYRGHKWKRFPAKAIVSLLAQHRKSGEDLEVSCYWNKRNCFPYHISYVKRAKEQDTYRSDTESIISDILNKLKATPDFPLKTTE